MTLGDTSTPLWLVMFPQSSYAKVNISAHVNGVRAIRPFTVPLSSNRVVGDVDRFKQHLLDVQVRALVVLSRSSADGNYLAIHRATTEWKRHLHIDQSILVHMSLVRQAIDACTDRDRWVVCVGSPPFLSTIVCSVLNLS